MNDSNNSDGLDQVRAYYTGYDEMGRTEDSALNRLMTLRTRELFRRFLPHTPAVIADVGGGPGVHARWLADHGYDVHLRDLVPLHIEQASAAGGGVASIAIGDARQLDLADESCDAVLLMGPLYHLQDRGDRMACLIEAMRILRPDGVLMAEAISRVAALLDSLRANALTPDHYDVATEILATGNHSPGPDGPFTTAHMHAPTDLAGEIIAAGFDFHRLISVEGAAWSFGDLEERLADPYELELLLRVSRDLESDPSLVGHAPHIMAIATRPPAVKSREVDDAADGERGSDDVRRSA